MELKTRIEALEYSLEQMRLASSDAAFKIWQNNMVLDIAVLALTMAKELSKTETSQ